MKKLLIGIVFSIIGSSFVLAVTIIAGNNSISSWVNPPGLFISTILELGIMPIFILGICLLILGLTILIIELFKKDK